jgi:hypothetical protein
MTSSDAVSHSACQEIPRLLWDPNVHYRVHRSPTLDPVLIHMTPILTITSYYCEIHFNIISHMHIRYPSVLFPYGFPTEILFEFFIYMSRRSLPP